MYQQCLGHNKSDFSFLPLDASKFYSLHLECVTVWLVDQPKMTMQCKRSHCFNSGLPRHACTPNQLHLWSFWGHSHPKTQLVFSVGVSQSDSRSQKGWRRSSAWDKYDTYLWINPLWAMLKKNKKTTHEKNIIISVSPSIICLLEKKNRASWASERGEANGKLTMCHFPACWEILAQEATYWLENQTICSLLLFPTSLSASLGCRSVSLHERRLTNSVIRTRF